jgi:undecaprenyldiphospho-muramoylpentapeptide beta-N-acetylglucosaminyltransferase
VYPALAVFQALPAKDPPVETLWVGGEAGMEADLVKREGIRFAAIPAAGVHGVGPRALPGNLSQLARGFAASRKLLKEFRPDVMLFTGGYVAPPMALAGRRTPMLLYVPDIEPGLALKTLAWFADGIAVTTAESQKYFRKKVTVTGYPVREHMGDQGRAQARRQLALDAALPVVLVAGGSKGARSINRAVAAHLAELLEIAQVIHVTGRGEWDSSMAAAADLGETLKARYRPFPYLHEEMGAALAAADLAVMRAGASVLGELPAFGLPAILVPYPHAWRYQRLNAQYLTQAGAAEMLEDAALEERLLIAVRGLLEDEARRSAMAGAMRALARPGAARKLAELLLELGGYRQ